MIDLDFTCQRTLHLLTWFRTRCLIPCCWDLLDIPHFYVQDLPSDFIGSWDLCFFLLCNRCKFTRDLKQNDSRMSGLLFPSIRLKGFLNEKECYLAGISLAHFHGQNYTKSRVSYTIKCVRSNLIFFLIGLMNSGKNRSSYNNSIDVQR